MNTFYRYLGATLLAMCLGFTGSTTASAVYLPAATTVAVRSENEPVCAQLIASKTSSFNLPDFTGTLSSRVWSNDAANPWGGLTFCYKLSNESSWRDAIGNFALYGFAGLLVDASSSCSGVAPRTASRSCNGDEIAFNFVDKRWRETLISGSCSSWLILQTDTTEWGTNNEARLDCRTVTIESLAPVRVPEPTTSGLMILSGLAGWVLRRQKP